MKPNGKWSFYLDDEDYVCQDWFDDENDALIAGMEEAKSRQSIRRRRGVNRTGHQATTE